MEGSEDVLPPGTNDLVGIPVEDPGKEVIQPVVKMVPSGEVVKELSDEMPEELPNEPPQQLPDEMPCEVPDEAPGEAPDEAPDEVPDELPNNDAQGNNPVHANDSAHGSGDLVHAHHSQVPIAPAGVTAEVDGAHDVEEQQVVVQGGRRELTEADCESELGYAFSSSKKWKILTIIFLVQVSMNFNTSIYSSGISGIAEKFDVTHQIARYGAMLFLITYALGCELWAPWSEELGRRWVLQASMTLINLTTVMVAFAPNVPTVLVGRALGGLSTAGGSVTLGLIADLYDSDNQQYAVAYM